MKKSLSNEVLIEAATKYGTPLYVYHVEKISEQYNKLIEAFKHHPTKFFYACKALTNIQILKHLKQLGAGLDCVSINEVKLGLHAGFEPHQILFTPNCVAFDEYEEATKLGININIDSIEMLEQFGSIYGDTYPVCIRINPHIEAGGNYKISTGHIDSKFGISIHQVRHIVRIVKATKLNIQGLHMHTGSEIKDVNVFIQALDVLLSIAHHFDNLKFIDLGSGFKIPYKDEEIETDISNLGLQLSKRMIEFEKEHGHPLEVWFEPGKYLVSECGYFLVNANIIKQTTATVFVGINSGFNHLIRPMFYDAYHKISNISNPSGNERVYTVVGNICETDTFAWDRLITEVSKNDILVFHNAGAYGFEMSSNFNSRLKPAEVMYKDGQLSIIRKRQIFEDLLINQVEQ